MSKPYRCRGSFTQGTACANIPENLPEGITECSRCTAKNYTKTERDAAITAEKERTKNLPTDRVKRGQEVTLNQ